MKKFVVLTVLAALAVSPIAQAATIPDTSQTPSSMIETVAPLKLVSSSYGVVRRLYKGDVANYYLVLNGVGRQIVGATNASDYVGKFVNLTYVPKILIKKPQSAGIPSALDTDYYKVYSIGSEVLVTTRIQSLAVKCEVVQEGVVREGLLPYPIDLPPNYLISGNSNTVYYLVANGRGILLTSDSVKQYVGQRISVSGTYKGVVTTDGKVHATIKAPTTQLPTDYEGAYNYAREAEISVTKFKVLPTTYNTTQMGVINSEKVMIRGPLLTPSVNSLVAMPPSNFISTRYYLVTNGIRTDLKGDTSLLEKYKGAIVNVKGIYSNDSVIGSKKGYILTTKSVSNTPVALVASDIIAQKPDASVLGKRGGLITVVSITQIIN